MFKIKNDSVQIFSNIPYGTHNPMPYKDGILLNNTYAKPKQISFMSINGKIRESYYIPHYQMDELTHINLPKDHAVQSFARGLCTLNDEIFIGGSSPATFSVYQVGHSQPIKSIRLTNDIRNAIHGLEIWPY